MAGKSTALADRFDMEIERAVATLEGLSDADWHKVTAAEGWPVGLTAHHFAGALENHANPCRVACGATVKSYSSARSLPSSMPG